MSVSCCVRVFSLRTKRTDSGISILGVIQKSDRPEWMIGDLLDYDLATASIIGMGQYEAYIMQVGPTMRGIIVSRHLAGCLAERISRREFAKSARRGLDFCSTRLIG